MSEILSKYTKVFMRIIRCSCQVLIKLEFTRQIFEKYSNINFRDNPFSGSPVFPYGRTDRHDRANSRFSEFLEHV